jgi:hypothetical protein
MTARRAILSVPRRIAMAALAPIERRGLERAAELPPPRTVFIIGPPRSGTTLLYELLAMRFGFAYFSNAAHRLPHTPITATRLFRPLIRGWRGTFQSDYGRLRGWGAPSEAGWIWDRWMGGFEAMEADDLDPAAALELRCSIAAVADALGGPFLAKNVAHSVRMRALDRIFPDAVFIALRRDEGDVIRSIYRMRQRRLGEPGGGLSAWLSVRPRGWESHRNRPPIEQIAAQVFGVQCDIGRDALAIGPGRLHCVQYEELASDPRCELERIRMFMAGHGILPPPRFDVPPHFDRPALIALDDDLERQLVRAVETWRPRAAAATRAPIRRRAA